MKCKICNNESKKAFDSVVIGRYPAEYCFCADCGFLQVGNPTWLAQAYAEPINLSDVGYVSRNVYHSRKTLILFVVLFGIEQQFLDYGAGYGMFVRLMRDYGLDFYWDDPYTRNLFARGFEYTGQKIAAVTCFESFEHFEHPICEIEKMLGISDTILFSTRLLPETIPLPEQWEYYGLDHGQHISFYSARTFNYIAHKYGLNLYTDGLNLHLLTKRNIPKAYFKLLLMMSTVQFDLILRKLLKSRIDEDYRMIRASLRKK